MTDIYEPSLENKVVSGNGYTIAQFREVFNLVADAENWKLSINKTLPINLSTIETMRILSEAVPFFTGSRANFTITPTGNLVVSAKGYYNWSQN